MLEWSVGRHTTEKSRPPGQFSEARGILGEVNDCLIVLDACEPASVWTKDGLFAGSLYGQRASDGLPDIAYNRIFGDDNHWGSVLKTPRGDVIWGGMSDNSTLFYRVRGWENWQRQGGRFVVKEPARCAAWRGTGLQASYFTNGVLSGTPAVQRLDAVVWFGPMGGAFVQIPAPWRGPTGGPPPEFPAQMASARWIGFFEPPVTEDFTFVVYTYGQAHNNTMTGSKIRLWVQNRLIIDEWEEVSSPDGKTDRLLTRACTSAAIGLVAGQLAPIRLEYAAAGGSGAHLHLFAGSAGSFDQRHIPEALLYPQLVS